MDAKHIKIHLLKNLHWLLAIFFTVVWLSGDDWMNVHNFSGYGILIISTIFISKRLVKGTLLKRLKDSFNIKWMSKNLILFILAFLSLASISGILADNTGKDFWEDFHEFLANSALLVIGGHIALKAMNKLKYQTTGMLNSNRYKFITRGHDFMNNTILNNSYNWLLTKWQKVTTLWEQSSGRNLLIRGLLISASLLFAVLVTSIFLAIFPFMILISVIVALIVKSEIRKKGGPVTINVTPETNQSV